MKTKQMMNITMLIAISILFHLIEATIPLPLPIPGFKLGLANIVGLVALYMYNAEVMLSVNLMRVLLASLMRGILFAPGFWLSLCGVLLSSIVAICAKRNSSMTQPSMWSDKLLPLRSFTVSFLWAHCFRSYYC